MKKIFLGIILGLGVTILATVSSGQKITAKKFNNSTFRIGDIKQSILSQGEFILIHGDCWKQMNSNINLTGTDLGDHIANSGFRSYTQIPDISGRVLRSNGGMSETLGSIQEDAFQGHEHKTLEGKFGGMGSNQRLTVTNIGEVSSYSATATPLRTNKIIAGDNGIPRISDETRMKNYTVNMFVKVNNDCN